MHWTFVRGRQTPAALAGVTALLVVAYVLVPHPIVQYGAWLVAFTVWMAWFVLTFVEWLSNADY